MICGLICSTRKQALIRQPILDFPTPGPWEINVCCSATQSTYFCYNSKKGQEKGEEKAREAPGSGCAGPEAPERTSVSTLSRWEPQQVLSRGGTETTCMLAGPLAGRGDRPTRACIHSAATAEAKSPASMPRGYCQGGVSRQLYQGCELPLPARAPVDPSAGAPQP